MIASHVSFAILRPLLATAGPNTADAATILRALQPTFLLAAALAAIIAAFSGLPDQGIWATGRGAGGSSSRCCPCHDTNDSVIQSLDSMPRKHRPDLIIERLRPQTQLAPGERARAVQSFDELVH